MSSYAGDQAFGSGGVGMREGKALDPTWDSRGLLGYLHALGVLDPAPDDALDILAEVAARSAGGPAGVYFRGGAAPLFAAGVDVDPSRTLAEPIRFAGLVVGEVRGPEAGRAVLRGAAATAQTVLRRRFETLSVDAGGAPIAAIVMDETARVVWLSAAFEDSLGHRAEAILGTDGRDVWRLTSERRRRFSTTGSSAALVGCPTSP
jgi:PAS domain-containing protein